MTQPFVIQFYDLCTFIIANIPDNILTQRISKLPSNGVFHLIVCHNILPGKTSDDTSESEEMKLANVTKCKVKH